MGAEIEGPSRPVSIDVVRQLYGVVRAEHATRGWLQQRRGSPVAHSISNVRFDINWPSVTTERSGNGSRRQASNCCPVAARTTLSLRKGEGDGSCGTRPPITHAERQVRLYTDGSRSIDRSSFDKLIDISDQHPGRFDLTALVGTAAAARGVRLLLATFFAQRTTVV